MVERFLVGRVPGRTLPDFRFSCWALRTMETHQMKPTWAAKMSIWTQISGILQKSCRIVQFQYAQKPMDFWKNKVPGQKPMEMLRDVWGQMGALGFPRDLQTPCVVFSIWLLGYGGLVATSTIPSSLQKNLKNPPSALLKSQSQGVVHYKSTRSLWSQMAQGEVNVYTTQICLPNSQVTLRVRGCTPWVNVKTLDGRLGSRVFFSPEKWSEIVGFLPPGSQTWKMPSKTNNDFKHQTKTRGLTANHCFFSYLHDSSIGKSWSFRSTRSGR